MPTNTTNDTPLDPSALIFYHGTSLIRYEEIMKEDKLRICPISLSVKLTMDPVIATYFARRLSNIDNSFPVLIPLSIILLSDNDYNIRTFNASTFFRDADSSRLTEYNGPERLEKFRKGEMEEEHRKERIFWDVKTVCTQDIFPLSDVLARPRRGAVFQFYHR